MWVLDIHYRTKMVVGKIFFVFLKLSSSAHCIYLSKNTVKAVILWKITKKIM